MHGSAADLTGNESNKMSPNLLEVVDHDHQRLDFAQSVRVLAGRGNTAHGSVNSAELSSESAD